MELCLPFMSDYWTDISSVVHHKKTLTLDYKAVGSITNSCDIGCCLISWRATLSQIGDNINYLMRLLKGLNEGILCKLYTSSMLVAIVAIVGSAI